MEPWIDSPTFFHLPPGESVSKPCALHTPGGTALNVAWSFEYAPDWMEIDSHTGLITGTCPDAQSGGKFGVDVTYDFLPDTHEMVPGTNTMIPKGYRVPAARVKPSKPPRPVKTSRTKYVKNANLYQDNREQFINATRWDSEALAKMLDNVDIDGDIKSASTSEKPPSVAWPLILGLVGGAFLAILMMSLIII